ncbi:MAG: DUF4381 domain-containing protein [Desulfobulbaceae bacterium]|nr:DUF4381 domain-containing protein [Desulfobulbaceae bacterium]
MNTAPDPLARLKDIHLPPPVSWWPPAAGWWILACLLLAGVGFGLSLWWRAARGNRYRRVALAALATLQAQHRDDGHRLAEEVATLLRRVAIQGYGRETVAPLTGQAWLRFLDRTGNTDRFSAGEGKVLGTMLYQRSLTVDSDRLCQLARAWIKDHRPC